MTYGIVIALVSIIYLPVQDWDEARRGVNALLMNCRADYLNYYYVDQPDTFNTKPPLFLWLVTLSFKAFGPGVVALRLPSLVALAGFLVYLRRWIGERYGYATACVYLAAIVGVQGIIGQHVGVSGDTDMLFVTCTTVACLQYFDYLQAGRGRALYVAVVMAWLALLTKGVATALVVPGVLLVTLLHPTYRRRLLTGVAARGLLLTVGLTGLAAYLLSQMGSATLPPAGYANLLEATLFRDGVQRLTDPSFEAQPAPFYVFQALDIRFGLLIYVLYAGLLLLPLRYGWRSVLRRVRKDRLAVFSAGITVSVLLLLHLSANKHNWYVAPAIPFLAYLFVRTYAALIPQRRWQAVGLAVLLVVSGAQRVTRIHRAAVADPPATYTLLTQDTPQHAVFSALLTTATPSEVRMDEELLSPTARFAELPRRTSARNP